MDPDSRRGKRVFGSGVIFGRAKCSALSVMSTAMQDSDHGVVTEIRWLWEPSSTYSVQIGLDGTLQSGSASSGGATLSSTFANHTARLETTCPSSSTSDSFRLIGAEVQTQLTSSG